MGWDGMGGNGERPGRVGNQQAELVSTVTIGSEKRWR